MAKFAEYFKLHTEDDASTVASVEPAQVVANTDAPTQADNTAQEQPVTQVQAPAAAPVPPVDQQVVDPVAAVGENNAELMESFIETRYELDETCNSAETASQVIDESKKQIEANQQLLENPATITPTDVVIATEAFKSNLKLLGIDQAYANSLTIVNSEDINNNPAQMLAIVQVDLESFVTRAKEILDGMVDAILRLIAKIKNIVQDVDRVNEKVALSIQKDIAEKKLVDIVLSKETMNSIGSKFGNLANLLTSNSGIVDNIRNIKTRQLRLLDGVSTAAIYSNKLNSSLDDGKDSMSFFTDKVKSRLQDVVDKEIGYKYNKSYTITSHSLEQDQFSLEETESESNNFTTDCHIKSRVLAIAVEKNAEKIDFVKTFNGLIDTVKEIKKKATTDDAPSRDLVGGFQRELRFINGFISKFSSVIISTSQTYNSLFRAIIKNMQTPNTVDVKA